jgi:plasmid maintenance system antidote protein VapI
MFVLQNDMVRQQEKPHPMNFQDIHELLRLELLRRIELGNLTGTGLARQAGFRQAHISNFLNRKRALSLDGLDRILAAQNLTVDQIMPLELSAASSRPTTDPIEAIPVVAPSTAMDEAQVRPGAVIETIHVSASQLQDNRSRPSSKCAHWQRFLAVRADAQQTAAMDPMIAAGAIVVLDRHYNSLAPYRAHQRTLYAVRCGAGLVLRYVEFDEGRLILRPLSLAFPVQLLALGSHETPADYIVGRVCLVVSEF